MSEPTTEHIANAVSKTVETVMHTHITPLIRRQVMDYVADMLPELVKSVFMDEIERRTARVAEEIVKAKLMDRLNVQVTVTP